MHARPQPPQQVREPAPQSRPPVTPPAPRHLAPLVTLSPLTLLLFCEQYLTPEQMAEAWDREYQW